MKQTIIRKDGIVYERKERTKKRYDGILYLRCKVETLDEIKEIAKEKGIPYTRLSREIYEEYVENYKKGKNNGR